MSGDRERAERARAPLVLAVPVFAAYVLSAAPPATVRRGVTFVNPYPTRRELLRVVGGNATLVATLNASGGEHVVELRDGDVYGWRERSRKRPRPLEDSVALRGGDARDVYVLGDATGGDATFTNGSPLTVTATHRSVRRSRNAMLEWDAADPGFVVNRLAARAHAFARRAARLDVDAGPAEPLNFIRYAEAASTAHCGGVCGALP
ncbi:hypothetical protein JL720_5282 [Aureococcus anophagefferens]|nr:hypothetical protein JL720_5282 [Aureococcus anophagefferens]